MAMSKKKILFFTIGFLAFGVAGYFVIKRFGKGGKNKNIGGLPFTNNTEGNRFRAWINDNFPAYAQKIDLDRTGSYNNAYVQQAWDKYGAQYKV